MTDWPSIIADLHALGWRYIDIAAEIDASEWLVSRVARGITTKVEYHMGQKLIALHDRELSCSVVPRGPLAQMQVGAGNNA